MADSSVPPPSPGKSSSANAAATSPKAEPTSPKAETASPRASAAPPRAGTASPESPGSPQAVTEQATRPEPQQTHIEVDEGFSDNVSIPDSQLSISGYTASVSSSVLDYPTENGRRYHAFRHGTYYGPNDEDELDRLDFNSSFLIKLTENKLYHAPLQEDKVHRILDVGTGTGIWAVEVSELFPNAEVIGNDLSPVQTTWVPPNVKFEVDDVESTWVAPKYDFIYSRFMAGAIADWPKLVKNTFANTNPGGWVEFQDWDLLYHSDDDSINDDHYSMKMDKMFMECSRKVGRDPQPGPQLEQWMRDAGFVNIHHKKIKAPLGTWPKDPVLRELGHMNMVQTLDGLEAYNLRLYTSVLGWTKEEAQILFAHVRNEMRTNTFHAYINYHVVYGQVPQATK
ncbi:methyltransferase domain-containing protein [Colletotrichum gloeosporioides Cg-14]|uniref:Methyltransferase domain-containing protein n=1 Tax=Colletotrichum gloeosporioides (strain Cg-14) TaxID=1237896 RepID=T0M5M3_COLGC|nr:methyltransferase domain-containing protein [Colletotrichum gloeosporioides Cg-14]